MRAFRHVYEEQLKALLKDSRDILQLVRSSDVKRGILGKIGGSTADIRSPIGGSLSSLSPARASALMSQSVADFGVSSSFSSSSQDSTRGITYVEIFHSSLLEFFLNADSRKYFHWFWNKYNQCVLRNKNFSTPSFILSELKVYQRK